MQNQFYKIVLNVCNFIFRNEIKNRRLRHHVNRRVVLDTTINLFIFGYLPIHYESTELCN